MNLKKILPKLSSNHFAKLLILCLLPTLLLVFTIKKIDNDSWFVLAEGQEIVEHGIYHIDQLSMHENLEVTVQNYGFAALYWLLYSLGGPKFLYICLIILNITICILLYKLFMLVSNKRENMSIILALLTDSLLITHFFITTRAQVVSYIIFIILIYLLELFLKTDNKKYLYFIPLLSIIQINLHASLWLMLFLVMGTYILDSLASSRNTKPLIVVFVISFLVGILNPYGIKMIVFVLLSYTDGTIQLLVNEMQPFDLASPQKAFLYSAIASVLVLCIYNRNKKQIKLRYVLLFFGFLGLGLNTIKGMSQFILIMFLIIIPLYKNTYLNPPLKTSTKTIVLRGTCLALIILTPFYIFRTIKNLTNYPATGLSDAFDTLDKNVESNSQDKKSLKVYVDYDHGGYAEFRGYKPYMDPRAEVFLKINNKKEDLLSEYIKLMHGNQEKDEFLEKYDFDYILTTNEVDFEKNSEKIQNYEKIFTDTDETVKLFKKKAS